jgi:hypothetical protein
MPNDTGFSQQLIASAQRLGTKSLSGNYVTVSEQCVVAGSHITRNSSFFGGGSEQTTQLPLGKPCFGTLGLNGGKWQSDDAPDYAEHWTAGG